MFEALPTTPSRHFNWRDGFPTLVLVFIWLLAGLFHQPWLPNETNSFAAILGQLHSGLQAAPAIDNSYYTEHPPLLFWAAALSAKLFAGVLPLHDGARIASALFTFISLAGMAIAAHFTLPPNRSHIAILALFATLGFMAPSHGLIPATTATAGTGLILAGFSFYTQRPVLAALIAASGAVIGFLGHGLMTPLAFLVTLLLLPFLPGGRMPHYRRFALLSIATLTPVAVLWPVWLASQHPAYLHGWLHQEMLRFAFSKPLAEQLATLSWFTWPTLPLLLLGGSRLLKRVADPRPLYPALLLALCWLIFAFSSLRELDKLPLLLPLALLAAAALQYLRRGWINGFFWFGMMTILFFTGLFWFYWVVLQLGKPVTLAAHLSRLAPGHMPAVSWGVTLTAAALTVGWLMMSRWRQKTEQRCMLWVWASGATLIWSLIGLLLTGWLDYNRSLYPLAQQIRTVLPAQQACLDLSHLSPANHVLFDYYLALPDDMCSYALIESEKTVPNGMSVVWRGSLPSVRYADFTVLYRPEE